MLWKESSLPEGHRSCLISLLQNLAINSKIQRPEGMSVDWSSVWRGEGCVPAAFGGSVPAMRMASKWWRLSIYLLYCIYLAGVHIKFTLGSPRAFEPAAGENQTLHLGLFNSFKEMKSLWLLPLRLWTLIDCLETWTRTTLSLGCVHKNCLHYIFMC